MLKELSQRATNFLKNSEQLPAPRDRNLIIELFKKNDVPLVEAVINFEERFGGISFRYRDNISPDNNEGFRLGCFYADGKSFGVYDIDREDYPEYVVECMNHHVAAPVRVVFDFEGAIFMTDATYDPCKLADCAETFIENEALKSYFANNMDTWKRKVITLSPLPDMTEKGFQLLKEACDSVNTWWVNIRESLYVHLEKNHPESQYMNLIYVQADEEIPPFLDEILFRSKPLTD